MIKDASDWIRKWFQEIRSWRPQDVNNEKLTWLRVYGLPCHAWNPKVFYFMKIPVEHFVCSDEETSKHKSLSLARILIRTKYYLVLNQTYNISINDIFFNIKVVEDVHGPMRIALNSNRNKNKTDEESLDSSDDDSGEWNVHNSDKLWEESIAQQTQPSTSELE